MSAAIIAIANQQDGTSIISGSRKTVKSKMMETLCFQVAARLRLCRFLCKK